MGIEDHVEIGIYAHRFEPKYLIPLYESLKETAPTIPVKLWIAPGNVHQNFSKIMDEAKKEFYIVLDEDLVFLEAGWVDILIQDLIDNPKLGVVGTGQVKTEGKKFDYEMGLLEKPVGLTLQKWFPAHVVACHRGRVGEIRPDLAIPGSKGMSDLDYCLQVRKAGWDIGLDDRVVVYHADKPFDDQSRLELQNPTLSQEAAFFPQQVLFMWKKWGEMYKELTLGFNEQWLPRIRQVFAEDGEPCPW